MEAVSFSVQPFSWPVIIGRTLYSVLSGFVWFVAGGRVGAQHRFVFDFAKCVTKRLEEVLVVDAGSGSVFVKAMGPHPVSPQCVHENLDIVGEVDVVERVSRYRASGEGQQQNVLAVLLRQLELMEVCDALFIAGL